MVANKHPSLNHKESSGTGQTRTQQQQQQPPPLNNDRKNKTRNNNHKQQSLVATIKTHKQTTP